MKFAQGHGNYAICKPIEDFLNKLIEKNFIILNNGDYEGEPGDVIPNKKSLYFRLRSPIRLENVDLIDDAYELAAFGKDTYMCECHYHLVKLVS